MNPTIKWTFWIVLVATTANLVAMSFWSLPVLISFFPGPVFDLRFSGYTLLDARLLLDGLGQNGIKFYLNVQQILDLPYPALLAASLLLAAYILAPLRWGLRRYLLAIPALAGMTMDYLENALVRMILTGHSGDISGELVEWASAATQLKFQSYILAFLIVVILFGLWVHKRRT